MASKSGNLAEYLSGSNSKAVQKTLLRNAHAKQAPFALPPDDKFSLTNFGDRTEPETVDFIGPRGNNSFQNQFRRVNEREKDALRFTFGHVVGKCLIDIIKVEYDPSLVQEPHFGEVKDKVKGKYNKAHISMQSDYDPESYDMNGLWWLAYFIHEAAHIWQRNTGLHQEGRKERSKDYTYYRQQLPGLTLKVEEHAEAVKDWFFVNYGIDTGLVDLKNHNQTDWLWKVILEAFGFEGGDLPPRTDPQNGRESAVNVGLDALQELTEIWDPVIEEIRDPDKFPGCPRGFQLKLGLMAVGA